MRKLLYGNLRDASGQIISSATVNVFLAGTSTAVNLYSTATSSTPATITTSTDGSYTAYIDMFEVSTDQTFKITFSNTYTSLTVDNIAVNDVVLGTYTISTAKVCPYDIEIPKGVVFAKSGSGALTFSKCFSAGQYQVFSGFTKGVDVTFTVTPLVVWDRWFDGTSATGDETISSATITTLAPTTVSGNANFTGNPTFPGTPNFNHATGVSPFSVTSTTVVTNLNADTVDGKNAGVASGVATLDSNTRVVEAANLVWDGTGSRSASATATANAIPVRDANKDLPDRNGNMLFGIPSITVSTSNVLGTPASQDLGTVTTGDIVFIFGSGNWTSSTSGDHTQIIGSSGTATKTALSSGAGTIYASAGGETLYHSTVQGLVITGDGTLTVTYGSYSAPGTPTSVLYKVAPFFLKKQ